MASSTLATLRAEIRRLGHYENSPTFTNEFINERINKALEQYHDAVADSVEGYLDKVDESLVTVSGTQTVALPSDHYRLLGLDRLVAVNEPVPLRRLTRAETYRYAGSGVPVGYMLFGGATGQLPGRIRLWPVPDGVYSLRLTYIPRYTPMVLDADALDFLPGGDDFIVQATLADLDARDEKNPAPRIASRDVALAKVKGSAARRNEGEPEYLVPRYGYYSEED